MKRVMLAAAMRSADGVHSGWSLAVLMVLLARIAVRVVWRNHPRIAQPGTARQASPLASPLAPLGRVVASLPPPIQAGLWMSLGGLAFAGMSGVIRHLSGEMHPFVVAFYRSLFGLIWMVPWLVQHGATVLRTRRRLFYTIRASFSLFSMLGAFYGVAYMPIADATAISFTGPLFATAGAALILHETVRLRRWLATLVGFAGVLVVVRPGPDSFNPVA